MHQLICNIRKNVKKNIKIINKEIGKKTRKQLKSSLWFKLKYRRITVFKALKNSRCQSNGNTLISLILGGKILDTTSMKRRPNLELEDRVKKIEKKFIKKYISESTDELLLSIFFVSFNFFFAFFYYCEH